MKRELTVRFSDEMQMVTLRDFKKGDPVLILTEYEDENPEVQTATVISVGRKYVKTKDDKFGRSRQFEALGDCYLQDFTYQSYRPKLFRTAEDLSDYLEYKCLKEWLDNINPRAYSLKQLRQVRKILEGID